MSFYSLDKLQEEDPILSLGVAFKNDPRKTKVNLGIGAYQTAEGKPFVLSCVRQAEALLLNQKLDKEYLPIEGYKSFIQSALPLIFGSNSEVLRTSRVAATQTIGGTAALRIGAECLRLTQERTIFVPAPSWPNHKVLFTRSSLSVENYPYFDPVNKQLDFIAMCETLKNAPEGSIALVHVCCHNPTGVDLNMDQWKELSALMKAKNIFPFLDFAYQGFSEGIEADAAPVRYLVDQGHDLLVASSYSKNLGLYGERLGVLAAVTANTDVAQKVQKQFKSIVRGIYSSPPLHGAQIAATIFDSDSLRKDWLIELQQMRERIQHMREALIKGLYEKGCQEDLSFMSTQRGLFSYGLLNHDQVATLRDMFGIYMPSSGRINVAGLNPSNLQYVIDAILSVIK